MIKTENLTYRIKEFSILQNLNFEARKGEFITIIGPNGAGKSSFLAHLANEIDSPEKNKILLKGQKLSHWEIQELAYHKAKFSQHYSGDIPLLVKEVVLMGRYPYFEAKPQQKDLDFTMKMMQKTDILHLQDREYNTLSGGEMQRVHLARAFAQLENEVEEKIIFLDEPLNNLDVSHQHHALKMIKDFTQNGNTAVVVLHDLNLAAEFSDQIFLMKEGKMVLHGTPIEVFQEEIISEVYQFPCKICKNPLSHQPLILFGKN